MAVNSLRIQHLLVPHIISDYTIGHRKRLEMNCYPICRVVHLAPSSEQKTRQRLIADRVSVLNE